jgi:tetratricopeptide (TPR) repeat protein
MEIKEFYLMLDQLYQTGPIAEVEAFLAKIADQSLNCCGRVSELGIACLNEQGSLYRSLGNYEESVCCFLAALDYLALQFGSDSPEYLTTLGNLAGTYRQKGEINQAIQTFETCKATLLAKGQAETYLYATTLNNLALAQMETGNNELALDNLEDSVAILATIPGTELEQATAQVNLSILYQRQGDLDRARQVLAAALYQLAQNPADPHYWAALNQKASLAVQANDFAVAEQLYCQVRDHLQHTFGSNREYAITCFNLAKTQEQQKARDRALESADMAMNAYKKILGDNHSRTLQAQAYLEHLRGLA